MSERWTIPEMRALAANAVAKVDIKGTRGITLCTMDEIAAMAGLLVATGALMAEQTPLDINKNKEETNV